MIECTFKIRHLSKLVADQADISMVSWLLLDLDTFAQTLHLYFILHRRHQDSYHEHLVGQGGSPVSLGL